jgi:hypothetical protein
MVPEGALVVSSDEEAFGEQFLGNDACLREAVHSSSDLAVHIAVADYLVL